MWPTLCSHNLGRKMFKIRRDVFHGAASTYNRNLKKLMELNSTEALDGQLMDLRDPGPSLGQTILHDDVTHLAVDTLLLCKSGRHRRFLRPRVILHHSSQAGGRIIDNLQIDNLQIDNVKLITKIYKLIT